MSANYSARSWGSFNRFDPYKRIDTPDPDTTNQALPEDSSALWNTGEPMERLQVKDSFQATDPVAPTTDWGSIAGAGVTALGSAAGGIAQAAAQKFAMDQAAQMAAAGRATSEKLAKMRLAASRQAFQQQGQMSAYESLLSALGQQTKTSMDSTQLRRNANLSMEQLFAQALLRGA